MINKLVLYLKALKVLLISKSIRKARFFIYERDIDVSKFDDDMLLIQLGYFGHHTEKAIKHHNRGSRGKQKRDKLEMLIKEVEARSIEESKVIDWAKHLIEYFDTNKNIYIDRIDDIEPHPQKDEILHFIKTRTTTRFWQAREIEDDIIQDVLETAICSALSCNRQSIRFSVVKNKVENMIVGDSNNQSMFDKAPVAIYIADDERFFQEKYGNALDVGGVCSLIQLAASAYGVSSTWMYYADSYDQKAIRKELNIPDHMFVYSAISLGYPFDNQIKPPRYNIEQFLIER